MLVLYMADQEFANIASDMLAAEQLPNQKLRIRKWDRC